MKKSEGLTLVEILIIIVVIIGLAYLLIWLPLALTLHFPKEMT